MTRVYFVRHGQSMANVQDLVAGFYDAPLSALGEEQARLTASLLSEIPFSAIYASDLKRACSTGLAIADDHGLPLVLCEGLRECFAGDWEGRPFAEIIGEPDFDAWMHRPGEFTFPGGESLASCQKRVVAAVNDIVAAHPGETVCVAGHAVAIRVLECHWRGLPINELNAVPWVGNASVTIVDYEIDGTSHIVERDIVRHLGELSTVLPDVI